MKDSLGGIIYVGKAKNLKKRVQSYFLNSRAHPPKIKKLIKNLKDFDYLLTDTEFEAFMLECQLIKQIKPFFNKMMKSPQSYTYIGIPLDDAHHKIEITPNCNEKDGYLYFGPFTSKRTVERAIEGIKECFNINCSNPPKKNSPCLNYSLGLCIGICMGGPAFEMHRKIMNKIIALLNGTNMSIIEEMKQRMFHASEKFDFETATRYRDNIEAIDFLIKKEKVIEFTEANQNIVAIEYFNDGTFKLFLIKRNQVLYSEKYIRNSNGIERLNSIIKNNVLHYFQTEAGHSSNQINRYEIDEAQIIYSYLKTSHCSHMIIPEKWLEQKNTARLDEELDKLLCNVSPLKIK